MSAGLYGLKRMMMLFWAAWWSLAFLTNAIDACRAMGLAQPAWGLASGNYEALHKAQSRTGAPRWVGDLLFGGVLIWEAVAALQFWRAAWSFRSSQPSGMSQVNQAFSCGLSLWGAFMVADEFFVDYETGAEAAHMRTFTAQLTTLIAMHVLPD